MKINFIPKTKPGKWSIVSIVVMPVCFYIGMSFVSFYESIPAGKTIPHDIVARPGVALSMLAGFVFGITAFITGLTSIIKHRERALLVFASMIIGALLILFLAAEIIFPH